MSKNVTSLSSIEIEAVAHFHIGAKALGVASGRFGPLKITKHDYLDGKTVWLQTTYDGSKVEGRFFFQKKGGAWVFCGVTNNQIHTEGLGWTAELRFWEGEYAAEYEIKKRYYSGGTEVIKVDAKLETLRWS